MVASHVAEQGSQRRQSRLEGMCRRPCIADDQPAGPRWAPDPVAGEPLDRDAALPPEGDDIGFPQAPGRQLDQRVQPGGYAADSDGRRVLPEHAGEPVPSGPVPEPALSDMPVVGTAVDHVRKHQLVDDTGVLKLWQQHRKPASKHGSP